MKGIKIGDKISKLPIIQGGMGVGISMNRLAGNVRWNWNYINSRYRIQRRRF